MLGGTQFNHKTGSQNSMTKTHFVPHLLIGITAPAQ